MELVELVPCLMTLRPPERPMSQIPREWKSQYVRTKRFTLWRLWSDHNEVVGGPRVEMSTPFSSGLFHFIEWF